MSKLKRTTVSSKEMQALKLIMPIALKRTKALFHKKDLLELPLHALLANAYIQGVKDTVEAKADKLREG
jgi:hypothetical protein